MGKVFKWIGIVFVALIALSIIGKLFSFKDDVNKTSAVEAITKPVLSIEKFYALKTGMSYEQVKEIIGSEGQLSAETHMDAVPGVMDEITTKIYMWKNPDGSNCNVTFQNNKLNMKAQFGL